MRVCVHHAVGDVEDDHQPGRERGHRYLGELAEPEQQQEQREHRRRRRRAEEIDHEFERAVDALIGAEHDPDRNPERGGDGKGVGDPQQRLQEILGHRAGRDVLPGVRQRRERRRQQVRIDQGAGIGHPPERDQQRRPHDELDDAAEAPAVRSRRPGERWVGRGCSERHPDASIGSNAQRVA
jgi:hypothetical protein